MSMGYYGLAKLADFDADEGIALYEFDCFNINKLGSYNKNNLYNLDGILTLGFDINVRRFINNKGIIKDNVYCRSTIKVDKYSTHCIESAFQQGVHKFSNKFNDYVERYNKIPEEIHFVI